MLYIVGCLSSKTSRDAHTRPAKSAGGHFQLDHELCQRKDEEANAREMSKYDVAGNDRLIRLVPKAITPKFVTLWALKSCRKSTEVPMEPCKTILVMVIWLILYLQIINSLIRGLKEGDALQGKMVQGAKQVQVQREEESGPSQNQLGALRDGWIVQTT